MTKRKIEIRPTRNSEIDKAVELRVEQRVEQRTEELLERIAMQSEQISDLKKTLAAKDGDIRELQHRLARARDARDAMDTRRNRQDAVGGLSEEDAQLLRKAIDHERSERERRNEDLQHAIGATDTRRRRQNTRSIYRG